MKVTMPTVPATPQRCAIGVVVPVYNRPISILLVLESIRKQTVPPKQLVIANDGSTDNTAESAQAWIAEHSDLPFEVYILRLPNGGLSFARNKGFAVLRDCDAVLFLDSDDLPQENFLEVTSAILQSSPQIVAVSSNIPHVTARKMDLETFMLYFGAAVTSNTLFRCSLIKEMGGFNESLLAGEDSELFLRIVNQHKWLVTHRTNIYRPHGDERPPGEEGRLKHMLFMPNLRWAFIHWAILHHLSSQERLSWIRLGNFHWIISNHLREALSLQKLHEIMHDHYTLIPPMVKKRILWHPRLKRFWHNELSRYHRRITRILTRRSG
jgi:glycosyltransferase involved in cell wall biosynthesis